MARLSKPRRSSTRLTSICHGLSSPRRRMAGSRNETSRRALTSPRASRFSRSCHRRSGSQRISRKASSLTCGRANWSRSMSTPIRARSARPCGQHPTRLRNEVHSLSAGKRHRKFRQGGSARAGENRDRQRARSADSIAARHFCGARGDRKMSSTDTAAPATRDSWKPAHNPWLIAGGSDARGVHGNSRHDDRQCRVASYCRQPVVERR